MQRREFVNFAFLLPVLNHLKAAMAGEELLHFEQADLEPLLKIVTPENKAISTLFMKNLLFDVEFILTRVKDINDVRVLKNLAIEADKKFYADHKLSTNNYQYQTLNLSAFESLMNSSSAAKDELNKMMANLMKQIDKLKEATEKVELVSAKILTSFDAISEVKKDQACARTWSLVGCIIACVVCIVIAIVVTVFSFGAGSPSMYQTVSAILVAASLNPSVVIVEKNNLILDKTRISLEASKIDFSKINLDKLLKCSISSAGIASAMAAFGKTPYPANPLASSLALNFIALVKPIPGIDTYCW